MKIIPFLPEQSIIDKMPIIIPKGIIVHHSGGNKNQTMESLRDWFLVGRKSEGYIAIGYHICIKEDGTIYQTRPFDRGGGHCPGYNQSHVGIVFMGDYRTDKPTREAWQSFSDLAHMLMRTYGFTQKDIIPHCDAKKIAQGSTTICPGTNILALLKTPLLPESVVHEPGNVKSLKDYTALELAEALTAKLK
jgi:hypothetical protein